MPIVILHGWGMSKSSKDKLIETAIELVWRNSYGSVSVDEICKTADVKKGSFYHFFPSKVDLAIAAMEQCYQDSKPFFEEIFSSKVPPEKRFDLLADKAYEKQAEIAEKYGRVCGCPFASLGSEMAGQEEIIREKVEATMGRYKKRYYEIAVLDLIEHGFLPESTNVKEKAEEIYTYVLGQIMMARIQNNLEPLKGSLKKGLRRIVGLDTSEIV